MNIVSFFSFFLHKTAYLIFKKMKRSVQKRQQFSSKEFEMRPFLKYKGSLLSLRENCKKNNELNLLFFNINVCFSLRQMQHPLINFFDRTIKLEIQFLLFAVH